MTPDLSRGWCIGGNGVGWGGNAGPGCWTSVFNARVYGWVLAGVTVWQFELGARSLCAHVNLATVISSNSNGISKTIKVLTSPWQTGLMV